MREEWKESASTSSLSAQQGKGAAGGAGLYFAFSSVSGEGTKVAGRGGSGAPLAGSRSVSVTPRSAAPGAAACRGLPAPRLAAAVVTGGLPVPSPGWVPALCYRPFGPGREMTPRRRGKARVGKPWPGGCGSKAAHVGGKQQSPEERGGGGRGGGVQVVLLESERAGGRVASSAASRCHEGGRRQGARLPRPPRPAEASPEAGGGVGDRRRWAARGGGGRCCWEGISEHTPASFLGCEEGRTGRRVSFPGRGAGGPCPCCGGAAVAAGGAAAQRAVTVVLAGTEGGLPSRAPSQAALR